MVPNFGCFPALLIYVLGKVKLNYQDPWAVLLEFGGFRREPTVRFVSLFISIFFLSVWIVFPDLRCWYHFRGLLFLSFCPGCSIVYAASGRWCGMNIIAA